MKGDFKKLHSSVMVRKSAAHESLIFYSFKHFIEHAQKRQMDRYTIKTIQGEDRKLKTIRFGVRIR